MDPTLTESRRNRLLLGKALEFARRDPGRILRLAPAKLWLLWSPLPGRLTDPAAAPLKVAFLLPLELLALLGLCHGGHGEAGRPVVRMLLALILFHNLLHVIMTGGPRFRAPIDPALAVLAAAGLRSIRARSGA